MRRWFPGVGVAFAGAWVGLATCVLVQPACFGIVTEWRGRPQPGTPRAAYCGPIDHWYRWLAFPLVAAVLALGLARLLRRGPHARPLAVTLVAVLGLTNALVVSLLNYFVAI